MNEEIRAELLKLTNGERLLRLEHAPSGLCLEKRLDAQTPITEQTGRWREAFTAFLARELTAV